MTLSKVKPCPFCPPDEALVEYVPHVGVRCRNCLTFGPEGADQRASVKKWNARAKEKVGGQIKNCPWCGEAAGLFEIRSPEAVAEEGFFVQCTNSDCCATGPLTYPLAAAAVSAWNTRRGEKG
ncbi:Lar family restriction alleviation protein [Bombella dulcis]|uniref:Lar family restriction alleviation protein n=1 Tax=Bombella dulcis TaxID=2967339 RepID=UPI003899185F